MEERRRRDLSQLGLGELQALAAAVDAEIARRGRTREQRERARGGLLEGAAPLYRNPQNPSETWSGRGPQPAWVTALRASGVRLDSLRVAPPPPAAPQSESRVR